MHAERETEGGVPAAEACQVSANTDCAPSDERDGEAMLKAPRKC